MDDNLLRKALLSSFSEKNYTEALFKPSFFAVLTDWHAERRMASISSKEAIAKLALTVVGHLKKPKDYKESFVHWKSLGDWLIKRQETGGKELKCIEVLDSNPPTLLSSSGGSDVYRRLDDSDIFHFLSY